MRTMSAHAKSQETFTFWLPFLPDVHVHDKASFVSAVTTSNKAK
jgi:hypothetical protein